MIFEKKKKGIKNNNKEYNTNEGIQLSCAWINNYIKLQFYGNIYKLTLVQPS